MGKLTQTEINTYYGHECYARINGKEFCDCEECARIRPKIQEKIWRDMRKNAKRKA